jgi:hypothetical protein
MEEDRISKSKKEKLMKELEKEKLELIQLRIRNKFYDREEILEKVVNEIIHHEIRYN